MKAQKHKVTCLRHTAGMLQRQDLNLGLHDLKSHAHSSYHYPLLSISSLLEGPQACSQRKGQGAGGVAQEILVPAQQA
jgi:hypothetical protein